MYPPSKRHAASYHSLQPMGSTTQYISVPDQQGIERRFPMDDGQMRQVLSIIGCNAQQPTQPQLQPGFGSLTSIGSFQSGVSAHSSQASGLNVTPPR